MLNTIGDSQAAYPGTPLKSVLRYLCYSVRNHNVSTSILGAFRQDALFTIVLYIKPLVIIHRYKDGILYNKIHQECSSLKISPYPTL